MASAARLAKFYIDWKERACAATAVVDKGEDGFYNGKRDLLCSIIISWRDRQKGYCYRKDVLIGSWWHEVTNEHWCNDMD